MADSVCNCGKARRKEEEFVDSSAVISADWNLRTPGRDLADTLAKIYAGKPVPSTALQTFR